MWLSIDKAKRKARHSMPKWYWYVQDGCWFCKTLNNCSRYKPNREFLKKFGAKKQNGRTAASKKCKYEEQY